MNPCGEDFELDPVLLDKVEAALIETMRQYTTVMTIAHSTTTMIPTAEMSKTAIYVILDHLKARQDA